jgi:hypothetical protein
MDAAASSDSQARRLPARVQVGELLSSRYDTSAVACDSCSGGGGHKNDLSSEVRPQSWDKRVEGVDTILTLSGEEVRLFSSAMQSPPRAGWVLLITGGSAEAGYTWTLYGIPPQQ